MKREKEKVERRGRAERDRPKETKEASMDSGKKTTAGSGPKEESMYSGKKTTAGSGHRQRKREQTKKEPVEQIRWKDKQTKTTVWVTLETWNRTSRTVRKKHATAAPEGDVEDGGRYPRGKGTSYAWEP